MTSDFSQSPAGEQADDSKSGALMRLATAWAVAVASFLILIKTAAWVLTGSVSILGSLIDSLMDAFASAVNFVAVRHALTPADSDHRFGHGKAEALAGLAQFALMSGTAIFLLFKSIGRLINPVELEKNDDRHRRYCRCDDCDTWVGRLSAIRSEANQLACDLSR